MLEKQAFIQGPFVHRGRGFGGPVPHQPPVGHNGATKRYFPVGAKGTTPVPLAVVEDLSPESRIEIPVAVPSLPVGARIMEVA